VPAGLSGFRLVRVSRHSGPGSCRARRVQPLDLRPQRLHLLVQLLVLGLELILVVFHLFQFGPGGLYKRGLLVDGVSQVFDDLPDLLSCHSSAAGSGVGWLRGA
jgi:hypothetical protein